MIEFPSHWTNCQLGERIRFEYGKSPNEVRCSDGKYPVYGSSGKSALANNYTTESPAIIVGRKGTIDKPIFLQERCWAIDTTFFIDNFPSDEPRYLYYLLDSINLKSLNESTGVPSLSRDALHSIPVSLPPLPEQKKIAEILSRIDHLIRREDECHDAMSSLLQSHLRSQRFSNGESIAISDACLLVADCMHKTPVFEETGFPIVRTPNVRDGMLVHEGMKFISEESYREWIQKDKPEPGDILFTREAPLGEACLVPKDFPLCIGQRMMLLRANPRILSPEFLLFRLRSLATQQKLQLLSGGSTVGHANVKDIRNLEIEIPNESEQRIAISIYESISCCIDKHATKKQKLLHLKQALATDLLSGRKRVST